VPFTFLDTKSNQIQGVMVDIITEIGKDAGSLGFLSLQALRRFGGDFGRPVSKFRSRRPVAGAKSDRTCGRNSAFLRFRNFGILAPAL
jgi:hypothetical protein